MALDRKTLWWLPGFLVSFVCVGLSFWFLPYNSVQLPTAILNASLFVVAISALLTRVYAGRNLFLVALVIGAAIPAALFARVLVDTLGDPTSHNLWPLELLIGMFVGGPVALAGALPGWLIVRLRLGGRPDEPADSSPEQST